MSGPDDRELPAVPPPGRPPGPPVEPFAYEEEVDLRDLWRVLWHRRWAVAVPFLVVVLAAAAFTIWQTPVWQSATLIRVEEEQKSDIPALDILSRLQKGSEIETEMRILPTRPILERVADSLDLAFRVESPAGTPRRDLLSAFAFGRATPDVTYALRRSGDGWRLHATDPDSVHVERSFAAGDTVRIPGGWFVLRAARAGAGAKGGEGEPLPDEIRLRTVTFERALKDLGEALRVSRPDPDAQLIRVSYEGTDRPLVPEVPNAVAGAYTNLRRHVQKTQARTTVAFLRDQSREIKTQMDAAEDKLQAYREGKQIVAPEAEAESQVKHLADLEAQRAQLASERDALSHLLSSLKSDSSGAAEYQKVFAFPTFLQNRAVGDIVQQLVQAEQRRTDLLTRRTEKHPDVQSVEAQIDGLQERLGEIGRNYLQSLNDQIASLDTVLQQFGTALESVPAKEIQLARLQRQSSVLTDLYTMLQKRLKEAQIAEAVNDASIRVVEAAVLPEEPVRPKPVRNLALAVFLGLLVGVGFAFLREFLDTRIHADEDVEETLGLPVLARVPPIDALRNGRGRSPSGARLLMEETPSVGAEAYRSLRTNVRFARGGRGAREIVVTSPGAREGKSLSAANLAVAFAQQGLQTVLVDADLRKPVQHEQMGSLREPGLSNVLAGQAGLDDALRETGIEHLWLLPAGAVVPNPSELLGGPGMDRVVAKLRERFEARVLDSPPVLAVTDAAVLGLKAEGTIVVVRAEQTHREAGEEAVRRLRRIGVRVLGVVLNDAKAAAGYEHYYDYYGDGKPRGLRRLLPFGG